mgnify:CR=1 FL=1
MCDVVSVTREQEPELEPGDPPEHGAVLGTWVKERTQFRLVSDISIALHSSKTC